MCNVCIYQRKTSFKQKSLENLVHEVCTNCGSTLLQLTTVESKLLYGQNIRNVRKTKHLFAIL